MKISIGTDHRGYHLKQELVARLASYEWLDRGAYDDERSDYPLFARHVCKDLIDGVAVFGVLICGSGIGMSIAANRARKIYAALCWNEEVTKIARTHDGANILVLPAGFISVDLAVKLVEVFVTSLFLGGRYQDRLVMMDE